MDSNEALHELARRARIERSLYIAEALSDAIIAVHAFIQRQLTRPGEAIVAKPARAVPAPQR